MTEQLTSEEQDAIVSLVQDTGYVEKEYAVFTANILQKITGKPYRAAHSKDCDADYFVALYNEDTVIDGDDIEWY